MKGNRSELGVGHIVVKVKDLKESLRFYNAIGLPEYLVTEDSVAIIQLRGGTNLLLVDEGAEVGADMEESRYGQMTSATREQIDLMLPTKKREDLEAYRDSIIHRGIQAGVIPVELYFGHNYFTVEDPDGHVIFIYTSHEQGLR